METGLEEGIDVSVVLVVVEAAVVDVGLLKPVLVVSGDQEVHLLEEVFLHPGQEGESGAS